MMFESVVPHKERPDRPIQEMWQEFCTTLISTNRPGIKRLLNWMQSDIGNGTLNFVNAPASTRFHGSYPGGLLEHSLNVYTRLMVYVEAELSMAMPEDKMGPEETDRFVNSCTTVALLHDICKIGFYTLETKDVKQYCENGSKSDKGGQFEWVPVNIYKCRDTHKLGHGAASVEIIERFLGVNGLSEAEKFAIRYHMGDFANEPETSGVYNKYPLAVLLHLADLSATYLDERECDDSMDIFWKNLNSFARPVKKPQPEPQGR